MRRDEPMKCQCTVPHVVFCLIVLLFTLKANAHEWMAPEDAAKQINPIKSSEGSIQRGRVLYKAHCISCHGENLEGMSREDTGLSKATPNLKKRLATHTEGDFFWKIEHGRDEMPTFHNDLTDNQIWDVINFISSQAD